MSSVRLASIPGRLRNIYRVSYVVEQPDFKCVVIWDEILSKVLLTGEGLSQRTATPPLNPRRDCSWLMFFFGTTFVMGKVALFFFTSAEKKQIFDRNT